MFVSSSNKIELGIYVGDCIKSCLIDNSNCLKLMALVCFYFSTRFILSDSVKMYNGIGLQTARGSGTNGYVQRNMALIRNTKNKVSFMCEFDIT